MILSLHHVTDNNVEKSVHHLFKGAHEKVLPVTYTHLCQMVEQAAAEAIYVGDADIQISSKIVKVADSQDFT